MPWTFAHPAAALAFNRVVKTPLELVALVIGTISPDIGYYLGSAGLNLRTHSLVGSLKLCLPMALMLLVLLILLRVPLCQMLPSPHRPALWPRLQIGPKIGLKSWLRICSWILIGAWTHIIWDACTHRNGLIVLLVPILQVNGLFGWANYQLAQHLSSVFGALMIVIAYTRWLRKNQPPNNTDAFESWRWWVIIACAVAAILIGLAHALTLANAAPVAVFWRVLLFQFAIHTTTVFAVLIALSALVFSWWIRRQVLRCDPNSKT